MEIEPLDVIVREVAGHGQRAAVALPLDPIPHGVKVEEDVVVPALPHTAAAVLTERAAAELGRRGHVQDVRVHDLLQVAPGLEAGVLQEFGRFSLWRENLKFLPENLREVFLPPCR